MEILARKYTLVVGVDIDQVRPRNTKFIFQKYSINPPFLVNNNSPQIRGCPHVHREKKLFPVVIFYISFLIKKKLYNKTCYKTEAWTCQLYFKSIELLLMLACPTVHQYISWYFWQNTLQYFPKLQLIQYRKYWVPSFPDHEKQQIAASLQKSFCSCTKKGEHCTLYIVHIDQCAKLKRPLGYFLVMHFFEVLP